MCGNVCVLYYDLNIFDVCFFFFSVQVFKNIYLERVAGFKTLSFSDLCTNN